MFVHAFSFCHSVYDVFEGTEGNNATLVLTHTRRAVTRIVGFLVFRITKKTLAPGWLAGWLVELLAMNKQRDVLFVF